MLRTERPKLRTLGLVAKRAASAIEGVWRVAAVGMLVAERDEGLTRARRSQAGGSRSNNSNSREAGSGEAGEAGADTEGAPAGGMLVVERHQVIGGIFNLSYTYEYEYDNFNHNSVEMM